MTTFSPLLVHYLIDTSSVVAIERSDRSAEERDEVWRMIVSLLQDKRMRLLDIVGDELRRNAGDEYFDRAIARLREWSRTPANFSATKPLNQMESFFLTEIIDQFPKMSGIGARGERADPYLVCLGRAGGYIVVTEESPRFDDHIPAACKHYGVECINLAQLIEREMGEN